MRNYATSIAKACSSIITTKQPSRAYSATSDFVSNRHPISIKTPGLNNEERHLVLVANSTGYLGTGNVISPKISLSTKVDANQDERYLCLVSKSAVDSYNEKVGTSHSASNGNWENLTGC
jgi:hypothetical protein